MAGKSNTEWTEHTWNPIVGCSIVSPGCTNCYAMKMAARIEAMKSSHYDGTTKRVNGNAVWTGKLALAPDSILLEPLRRKKPTTYFVNSMGDLFHDDAPDAWILRAFAIMALTPHHTYQVLTKRPERMQKLLSTQWASGTFALAVIGEAWSMLGQMPKFKHQGLPSRPWPLPNVWLGVSAERQQEADERIPLLLQTPAAVRFVSAEPLLGPINLRNIAGKMDWLPPEHDHFDALHSGLRHRLDWLIVGGESGPNARPMHPDWARSLRDQCEAAGVAFFFKQWGQFVPMQGDMERLAAQGGVNYYHPTMKSVGKKAAGRLLDGIEHSAMPSKVTA